MSPTKIRVLIIFLFIFIFPGSQCLDMENKHQWITCIARYILYITIIRISKSLCAVTYEVLHNHNKLDLKLFSDFNRNQLLLGVLSTIFLILNNQKIFGEDFPLLFIAYLAVKYPEIDQKKIAPPTVNYGVGMACSFFEGYLIHIIPSDGGKFVGFEENINIFESQQGVVFPVKKLFIIITKSLYCPPDLKHFNKQNRDDLPKLEACRTEDVSDNILTFQSLENVEKSVAGVLNRIYKNSAYKIYRPEGRPVCLAAECATPIHTLSRVLEKRNLYEELSDVDPQDIVSDFISTLSTVLEKSPDTRGKCELVFFDDTNPELNLADVLLDRIRELTPNFEELVNSRR